jgi:hypothetical protein
MKMPNGCATTAKVSNIMGTLIFIAVIATYLAMGGMIYGFLNKTWLDLFKDDGLISFIITIGWPIMFVGIVVHSIMRIPITMGEKLAHRRLDRLKLESEERANNARLLRKYEQEVEDALRE